MGTIEGMFHDDITFCPEQCDRKDCMRNSKNIRDKTVPHSYYAKRPDECPKRYMTEPVNGVSDVFIRWYGGGTNTRLIDIEPYEKDGWILQKIEGGKDCIIIKQTQLHEIPTVDAVPVVRCKECKAYYHEGVCLKRGMLIRSDDWFCADGERKKDD